jgi:hypothetical protein
MLEALDTQIHVIMPLSVDGSPVSVRTTFGDAPVSRVIIVTTGEAHGPLISIVDTYLAGLEE